MPIYTVETTWQILNFRQRTIEALTVEEAYRRAVADDDWSGETPDYENAGATYVTGIWLGKNAAYRGEAVSIPDAFYEASRRKVELFDTLLALLKEPAQPKGLSEHDFERWLPRALDAIAMAEGLYGASNGADRIGQHHDRTVLAD